ncbi:MAG: hypothetical protein EBS19_05720, partial [Spirochaetia bacterium]|nr:hypothetical protein [Spirochaetia bacterium]
MAGILGEYTEIFLEESEDQIEELNANLLKLESDHSNPDIINDIFRAAHSLKSSAAFVGLYNLSDLAHKMENLLQKIREDKLSVNVSLVNLLFECFDLIKVVIDAVGQGEKNDTPFTDMITKLENYEKEGGNASSSGISPPQLQNFQSEVVQTQDSSSDGIQNDTNSAIINTGFIPLDNSDLQDLEEEMRIRNAKAIDIKVVLKESTLMKGSRYALILESLKPSGVIFKSTPEEDDLLKGKEILELIFVFITQLDEEEIYRIIHSDLIQELVIELRSTAKIKFAELTPISLDSDEINELEEEMKVRNASVYDIRVILKADTPMKGLRFTLILQNLKHNSIIYKSNPDIEILERGTELNSLTFVLLTTMSIDAVKKTITVDMVEHIDISGRIISSSIGSAKERNLNTSQQVNIPTQANKQTISSVSPKKEKPTPVPASEKDDSKLTKSIKVSSEKLDQLMNNVGELVITNSGFQKIYDDLVRTFGDDTIFAELKSKIDQINRISKDLQSGIMNTRMVPIGSVFNRFSRLVRDLSMETGKKVQLILLGENTELDKKVVDM